MLVKRCYKLINYIEIHIKKNPLDQKFEFLIINGTLHVPVIGVHNPHSYQPIIIEHHLPNLFYRNQGGLWDLQRQKFKLSDYMFFTELKIFSK